MPGNVRLSKGDASLPKASAVNVTQVITVDKARLIERQGQLGARKRREVEQGLRLLLGDAGEE